MLLEIVGQREVLDILHYQEGNSHHVARFRGRVGMDARFQHGDDIAMSSQRFVLL